MDLPSAGFRKLSPQRKYSQYVTAGEVLTGARCACAADIDNDGDQDVVATGSVEDNVVWYENVLPDSSWPSDIIGQYIPGAIYVCAADINEDNYLDVVATSDTIHDVMWYENLIPGVHEEPIVKSVEKQNVIHATVFHGPLQLPEGKKCKIFDITGRVVEPTSVQPGIYFIEVEGVVTQKVVKIR